LKTATETTMADQAIKPMQKGGRESYAERAYRELKKRILDNELAVGQHYMEKEIAEFLDMSRTPTREALLRLANEGLVEIWPRHGMRIKPISIRDMREIYEILTALESAAAALAAGRNLDADQIDCLRKATSDMQTALEVDDLTAWAAADETFRRLLVEFSDNERLVALTDTFIDQSHRVRILTLRLRPKPTTSIDDHRAVLEAIERGDANAAQRLHSAHREKTGRMLIEILETHGLTQV